MVARPSAGETDGLRASATLAQPASGIPSGLMGQTIHSRQHTDTHTETEPQSTFVCDWRERDLAVPVDEHEGTGSLSSHCSAPLEPA